MIWVMRLSAIACLFAAVLAAMFFWDGYWRWRRCFNEQGRCFDPATATVHLEQAGMIWGSLTLLLLGLAVVLLRAGRNRR